MSKLERFSRAVGYGVGTVLAGADIALNHPASPLFKLNPFTATAEQVKRRIGSSKIMPMNYDVFLGKAMPILRDQLREEVGQNNLEHLYAINVIRYMDGSAKPFLLYLDGKNDTDPHFFIGTQGFADEQIFNTYEDALQAIRSGGGNLASNIS